MTALHWTEPRRRAIEAFANEGRARESNHTSLENQTVYWETLRWLERNGLVVRDGSFPGDAWYALTLKGRNALDDLYAHRQSALFA